MDYLKKNFPSENNSTLREVQVSSSSNESETNGNKNYSFVNTEKRCPHNFEETTLNSSAPIETLRDVERHKPLNLSPVEKKIILKVPKPENERIRFHSHSDGELFTEKASKDCQIHLTHELKGQPKIVSNINVAECSDCEKIQNLLENVLREREIGNSEFNLSTINDLHNESQEDNYSQNSSVDNESPENSLLDFMKVPEIILEKLKSLENVIDQERREKGTSDHIKKLFPLFLRSSDSGSELYTKKEIYLKDLCKKKSSKPKAVVDNKKSEKIVKIKHRSWENNNFKENLTIVENSTPVKEKIVKIKHRSWENNNSKDNLTIVENSTPVKETKIPKFEISCKNLQKFDRILGTGVKNVNIPNEENIQKNVFSLNNLPCKEQKEVSAQEDICILEKNDLTANNSEIIETKDVNENLVSAEEDISILEQNDLSANNSEIIENKSVHENLVSDEGDISILEQNDLSANNSEIIETKGENENLVSDEEDISILEQNDLSANIPEIIETKSENENLVSPEENFSILEQNDLSANIPEIIVIEEISQNRELNLSKGENILRDKKEEEEDRKEENNEINIEDDIRIVKKKLETIFEKSTEEKSSPQSREKSEEPKNVTTSEDDEENKEAETENSNSLILNNIMVNRTSDRTIVQFPVQINESNNSIMEITLKIKCHKRGGKNEGDKT